LRKVIKLVTVGGALTSLADRLYVEIDRQLAEIRTIADGLAARSGILTSASALAAGLLGTRFEKIAELPLTVLAMALFGLSTVAGFASIAPSMYVGMSRDRLTLWMSSQNDSGAAIPQTATASQLDSAGFFAEKIHFVERNHFLLHVARIFFYVQGASVVASVFVAFLALASRIEFPLVVEGPI
jgi:hypothetical protein